jgi:hypothetical protein
MKTIAYINNTNVDVVILHKIIMEAIENNGTFTSEYSDMFKLVKTPEGSYAQYALYFV